jgi:hypothetical protein
MRTRFARRICTRSGCAGEMSCARRLPAVLAAASAAVLAGAAPSAAPLSLRFSVFSHTGIGLVDIVWTGKQFLLVQNTETVLTTMDTAGRVGPVFAQLPRLVEETRCIASPGAHGFPAGSVYCHTPDNKIYRLSADGRTIDVLATLPESEPSDGALTADTLGAFGYGLVAATGRSGEGKPPGGTVYVVTAAGRVRRIGSYAGPGGADQVAVAPRRFGAASRQALLSVDAGSSGRLVAMDARGRTRTVARFDDGPNPIVPLLRSGPRPGSAHPGLYVTDTRSTNVYFAPASQVGRYAGVLVGSELGARFWNVVPINNGFRAIRLSTNLSGGAYNLEGARYVR